MHARPLIGLLTNDLVGTYQYSFWSGMKSAAAKEDCDLVSFNGGEIASTDATKFMRNECFKLVAGAKPDALVILSPVFTNSASREIMKAFLDRLGNIPLLTVGFTVPGHPAILVDNKAGVTTLVEHLVTVHQRRHIAFLGGPASNPDAHERRSAFLAVLKRHHIPFDPRLDLAGEFDFGIAREAVKNLLDAEVPLDGIVAANDDMALAAMEALRDRGRRIPDDVVVAGFDDIDDGRWAYPSLSTVHQPMVEQGIESLHLALDLVEGRKTAEVVRLPSRPVYRDSCGCRSEAIQAMGAEHAASTFDGGEGAPFGGAEHAAAVWERTQTMFAAQHLSETITEFVADLARDTRAGTDDASMRRFRFLVDVGSQPGEAVEQWQIFLSRLRTASLPYLPEDRQITVDFDGLLHQLRVVAHERAYQQFGMMMLQNQRWARDVHETGHRLASATDEHEIAEVLASRAKTLKIASLHLLLRDPEAPEGSYRLQLSIQQGNRRDLPALGQILTTEEFFRRTIKTSSLRTAFVMDPLFFQGTQLGFVCLELVARRGMLLDSLRGLISASLNSTKLGDTLSPSDVFMG